MLKFVTFAVKVQLNVHDLNNEAVAGNVTDIRIMEFLDENGAKKEAPAASGRMLKHWHYEGMRHLGLKNALSFCDSCKIGEPVRPAKLEKGILYHKKAISEGVEAVVRNCAICDIHGYLAAIGGKGRKEKEEAEEENDGQQGGVSERRNSRVMFSWLMPVLGTEFTSKQVIHSRVKSGMDFDEKSLVSQMPFNKSYASGTYAFVSALDVDRIGAIERNLGSNKPYAIEDEIRKKRINVAIEAYSLMISGQMGASLSHAIPHTNPMELLVAYSETGPLPFPVSPMYSDYISKTVGLMPQNTTFLFWGSDTPAGVKKKDKIKEIFEELLNKVE
ncbi:MAG: DevR family CRISPR-associated autoregulator [Candidatus Omnitrophica bacterium]|nr:DevR family CRISPR-associated autoregulator [Candidatus Omnitrophota bacterium]